MVLGEMQKSFASLGGQALADNAGLDAAVQDIDLISGLEIRRPEQSRSGFFVDDKGTILTTAAAVQNCASLTVNDEYAAKTVAVDETLGLAIVQTETPLAPMAVASFLTTEPRLNSDIAVSGFSYEGRLGSPSMTFGTLADLAGLQGQRDMTRLALNAMAGDAGGPVLDAGGAVVGVLMAREVESGRSLPDDVSFARKAGSVAEFLAANGVTPTATDAMASMDPVDISAMAADLTVLVSCWN